MYRKFIHKTRLSLYDNRVALEKVKNSVDSLREYLVDNESTCNDFLKGKLSDYDEFARREFVDGEPLLKRVTTIRNRTNSVHDFSRIIAIQLINYCHAIRKQHVIEEDIRLAEIKVKITPAKFREYLYNYYMEIQRVLLEGDGYKLPGGIGTLCINRWSVEGKNGRMYVDYPQSSANYKALVDAGKKPYNDVEASWYEARNLPYDGIKYRVYTKRFHFNEISIVNSTAYKVKELEFERSEYIAEKYRGLGYKGIAEEYVEKEEDVYNLQVDVSCKVNILTYKFPSTFTRFIRNDKEYKFNHRKNYRKN